MDDGQPDISREGCYSNTYWLKCHLHNRVNPLLRLVNLKLAADTGVRAVSFSYWYNLFSCSFYAQRIINTVNRDN